MSGWKEWKKKIEVEKGYAILLFTDRFQVDEWPLSKENEDGLEKDFDDKLLDMRVFCEEMESRIFRGDAGSDFFSRTAIDAGRDFYDDEQFLDIDETLSEKGENGFWKIRATGGGSYCLPVKAFVNTKGLLADSIQNAKIRLRNYIDYDEKSGQAYIRDWRLCGFKSGEAK